MAEGQDCRCWCVRGVDYWGKVCARCVVTEMWATHNCADTGLVVLADMEQNCIY